MTIDFLFIAHIVISTEKTTIPSVPREAQPETHLLRFNLSGITDVSTGVFVMVSIII